MNKARILSLSSTNSRSHLGVQPDPSHTFSITSTTHLHLSFQLLETEQTGMIKSHISHLPVKRVIKTVLVWRLSPEWQFHYETWRQKMNYLFSCSHVATKIFHCYTVYVCVRALISHFHSPVIAPPTRANPRDEPRAAACMVALPLMIRRRENTTVSWSRTGFQSCNTVSRHTTVYERSQLLLICLSQSHSHYTSQTAQDSRHAMQIVDTAGILDAQVGCQDWLQEERDVSSHFRNSIHPFYK